MASLLNLKELRDPLIASNEKYIIPLDNNEEGAHKTGHHAKTITRNQYKLACTGGGATAIQK